MVVKQIDGEWLMLLSYWDGGWTILNVDDPANPVYVADFEYPAVDPELLESFGVALTENAHQAEWTIDNRFIIGTDEDFALPHGRVRDHDRPARGRLSLGHRLRRAGSGDPRT